MKCMVLSDYHGSEALRLQDTGQLLPGVDELLVSVEAAGVNPVDAKMCRGLLKEFLPVEFPYVPGSDFSGVVVSVGPGGDPSYVGQRVMGMIDVQRGGAYAELAVVPVTRAVPVPDSVELMDAAALPMGVMTGYDLIEIGLDVRAGEKVIVTGAAGSVGRAAVFAAAERGAEVVAVVRSIPETAISGASSVIAASDDKPLEALSGLDCVADTVGGGLAQRLCGALRSGGRFSTVVGSFAPLPETNGAYSISTVVVDPRPEPLARFAAALAAGKVALPPVRTLPLAEAAHAHAMLLAGGAGRKLILLPKSG